MAWLGITAIIVVAVVSALMLRSARCPGWAIIGGVCAGILLGPSLLGRFAPRTFEQMYLGGRAPQRELEAAYEYQQFIGVDAERQASNAQQILVLEAEREAARWSHQQPMRVFALIVVAMVLLGAATGPRGKADAHQRPVGYLTIGGWSALLPGGVVFVVLHLLLDINREAALLAAAAVMIGPWRLTSSDVHAADQAELGGARLLHQSGMVASLIAIVVMGFAVWQSRGAGGLYLVVPVVALAMSWFLPGLRGRLVDGVIHIVLIPTMAALAAIKVELFIHFALWPLLVLVLLSGDGRWLGAYLGAMLLGGRRSLRTMRLVIGVMACGPTQLAIATLAGQGNLLDGSLLLAIIAGAVLLELLTPTRRGLAERIANTEAELDELADR